MSRFYQPLPFSPAYDFMAAKPVTLNGHVLNPGDPVPKDGLNPRRLRQLYEARIITPVAPEQLTASQTGIVNAPAVAAQEPAGEPEGDDAADTQTDEAESNVEAAAPATGGTQIVHRGFGRYYLVDADGNDVSGPWSKADAAVQLTAQGA